MRKPLHFAVAFLCGFFTAGCDPLKFGDDYEKDSSSFDANDLKTVEQRSRLTMPPGTKGLNLVYRGSGIDHDLIARLEIPASEIAGLEKQIHDVKAKEGTASESLADGRAWWDPAPLKVRVHRKVSIRTDYLELILGEEKSGKGILLVKWFET